MKTIEEELLAALKGICWKLERKEEKDALVGREYTWAKIDRNDACMEIARKAIARAEGEVKP